MPADILLIPIYQTVGELGIKDPLEHLQVSATMHPCLFSFYLYDSY